jgi:hypothetical protein
LIGWVSNTDQLAQIFGGPFVKPKQQADMGGYNTSVWNGEICGYLMFLKAGYKFSVCWPCFVNLF